MNDCGQTLFPQKQLVQQFAEASSPDLEPGTLPCTLTNNDLREKITQLGKILPTILKKSEDLNLTNKKLTHLLSKLPAGSVTVDTSAISDFLCIICEISLDIAQEKMEKLSQKDEILKKLHENSIKGGKPQSCYFPLSNFPKLDRNEISPVAAKYMAWWSMYTQVEDIQKKLYQETVNLQEILSICKETFDEFNQNSSLKIHNSVFAFILSFLGVLTDSAKIAQNIHTALPTIKPACVA